MCSSACGPSCGVCHIVGFTALGASRTNPSCPASFIHGSSSDRPSCPEPCSSTTSGTPEGPLSNLGTYVKYSCCCPFTISDSRRVSPLSPPPAAAGLIASAPPIAILAIRFVTVFRMPLIIALLQLNRITKEQRALIEQLRAQLPEGG